jgi:hypothetical protein
MAETVCAEDAGNNVLCRKGASSPVAPQIAPRTSVTLRWSALSRAADRCCPHTTYDPRFLGDATASVSKRSKSRPPSTQVRIFCCGRLSADSRAKCKFPRRKVEALMVTAERVGRFARVGSAGAYDGLLRPRICYLTLGGPEPLLHCQP